MITAARKAYNKKYYREHKGKYSDYHKEYNAQRNAHHKKPKVVLTETPCNGPLCWPKGLTFMSPDPTRVRRCDKCAAYIEGIQ